MLKDSDIREGLFSYLENSYNKIRIFEEKNIGESRADVLMVMDSLVYGIEIKSDADSYTRLESQIKDYDKYCDKNILVVGSTHGQHAAEHIPEYWGIITVEETENGLDFYKLREEKTNPKLLLKNQLELLWRPEIAHIQEINNLYKYSVKSKSFVREYILNNLEEDILKKAITDELFERDYTKIAEVINNYRTEHNQKKRRKRKYKKKKKGFIS